ncbi:MAG: PilZ domain-containing protein [Deltaproteobacteria bacterium]|nr:PilZ domain-containing protein [Deltaproteobacteria bacterium]
MPPQRSAYPLPTSARDDAGAPRDEGADGSPFRSHFRAHERREVRLPIAFESQRSGSERHAVVVDLSLAGAGLETEEALTPGDRLAVSFQTPTMWDPLVVSAVVAWAHPATPTQHFDALRRPKMLARSGIAFDYPGPDDVRAMFEMLATLDYE